MQDELQLQLHHKDQQIDQLKKEFQEYKLLSQELEEFLGEDIKRLQKQITQQEQKQEHTDIVVRRLRNEIITLERENDRWEAQLQVVRAEAEARKKRVVELEQEQDHLQSKIRIREHETSELIQLNESQQERIIIMKEQHEESLSQYDEDLKSLNQQLKLLHFPSSSTKQYRTNSKPKTTQNIQSNVFSAKQFTIDLEEQDIQESSKEHGSSEKELKTRKQSAGQVDTNYYLHLVEGLQQDIQKIQAKKKNDKQNQESALQKISLLREYLCNRVYDEQSYRQEQMELQHINRHLYNQLTAYQEGEHSLNGSFYSQNKNGSNGSRVFNSLMYQNNNIQQQIYINDQTDNQSFSHKPAQHKKGFFKSIRQIFNKQG